MTHPTSNGAPHIPGPINTPILRHLAWDATAALLFSFACLVGTFVLQVPHFRTPLWFVTFGALCVSAVVVSRRGLPKYKRIRYGDVKVGLVGIGAVVLFLILFGGASALTSVLYDRFKPPSAGRLSGAVLIPWLILMLPYLGFLIRSRGWGRIDPKPSK